MPDDNVSHICERKCLAGIFSYIFSDIPSAIPPEIFSYIFCDIPSENAR